MRLVEFHNLGTTTIEIPEGGHLFLLGDNGSGKTTILDAIHLVLNAGREMARHATFDSRHSTAVTAHDSRHVEMSVAAAGVGRRMSDVRPMPRRLRSNRAHERSEVPARIARDSHPYHFCGCFAVPVRFADAPVRVHEGENTLAQGTGFMV